MINTALKAAVEEKVPMNKPIPYTKRWWSHDLTMACKKKCKLANLLHKWRGLSDHHSYNEHKSAAREYVTLIEKLK